ncbi:MAG: 2OG-Fe(II) oxygenase [Alphaproteobacteria bacterium]
MSTISAPRDRTRLHAISTGDSVQLDREECRELGRELHEPYVNAEPFPHIVIDDFLPLEILRRAVAEFPARRPGRFADAYSRLKTGYQMEMIRSPYLHNLQAAFNSSQFLDFLEEMTGIRGLIPDPHFMGGGLHETARGGYLKIHADFNVHPRLNLKRRLNLILFLNEDWREDWGGQLELWETDMSVRRHSISPVANRAVVFNTDPTSFHGHPEPLACPENVYRRSIALYYYTAAGNVRQEQQVRTTDFRPRPGSGDKGPSLSVRLREIARDLVPPLLARRMGMY